MSVDSPFANYAFANETGVTFPLLGDMDLKAIKAYGLDKELKIGGVPVTTARRATFVINKDGKVVEESVDSEAVDPTKIVAACEFHAKKPAG